MSFSDLAFSATEIGAFEVNQQIKRIWKATNNRFDSPQTWQFRYDPLFTPEVENNQLLVRSMQVNESCWRTSLTMLLDSQEARNLAYQTVCKSHPDQAAKIKRSSVFAMPISHVKISIPDLKGLETEIRIVRDCFKFAQLSEGFTVTIESFDRATASKVEDFLSSMTLEYEFSVSARKSKQNSVSFSLERLKSSKLHAELNGLGDSAYVHRDDLRHLLEGIHTEVSFDAVIEKPEDFELELLNKLLDYWNQSESSKDFDEAKWRSTYNQNDLKPNIITKELNKIFIRDQSENHWKINPSFDIEADAGAIAQIKGKVLGKLSLSNDDLKKVLQERNIEADVQGTTIDVKSIQLCRVNLSDFNDRAELFSIVMFVEPIEKTVSHGSVDFSRTLSNAAHKTKNTVIALFGKSSVGKSAILNSLIGMDIAESLEQDDLLTVCIKLPLILIDLPGMTENEEYKKLAMRKAQQADGHIFVIDGEPYEYEIELFSLIHNHLPDTPKIIFVNKWDLIRSNTPKDQQETISSRISERMRKFVKSSGDIIYGNAMIFNRDCDLMIRQEIPQLVSRIKEIF